MTAQEIIKQVKSLPLDEQRQILEALQKDLSRPTMSEDEVERILRAKGIISEIPQRLPDDEEETYEPVEITGKSLSEIVIEERGEMTPQEIDRQLQERLIATGLISEIKPPRTNLPEYDFQPVEVKGEPVSETIIKERR